MFSEVPELSLLFPIRGYLATYLSAIRYIHITDQFDMSTKRSFNSQSASLLADQTLIAGSVSTDCARHRVMIIELALKHLKELSISFLIAQLIDRLAAFKLTNRQTVIQIERKRVQAVENTLRQSHHRRQEEAQNRKEEKKRAEKERLMNESDPEKQRKLMERIHKQEVKKKQHKIKGKQMVVRM